jgi:phage terminase large subunit
MHNRTIFGKELLYLKEQNNLQIAVHLFFAGCKSNSLIIADSAEPKSIVELRCGWDLSLDAVKLHAHQLGYNIDESTAIRLQKQLKDGYTVLAASKGQDSIDAGIQKLKQHEVFITENSSNAWMEYRKYRWAEDKKTGKLLNVPMDECNHFMDCLRYFCLCSGRLF